MPDSADIREINFLGRKCASAMFVYFQGSPETIAFVNLVKAGKQNVIVSHNIHRIWEGYFRASLYKVYTCLSNENMGQLIRVFLLACAVRGHT